MMRRAAPSHYKRLPPLWDMLKEKMDILGGRLKGCDYEKEVPVTPECCIVKGRVP